MSKKSFSKIIFTFFVCCVFIFSACENFLNAGLLREELEKKIEYEKADIVPVLVMAENQIGSTIPSGYYSVKVGYDFDLKFSENSDYCFVEWKAVLESDENVETDQIIIDNPKSPVTTGLLKSNVSGLKIYPYCIKRIKVTNEANPKWNEYGVSRDHSITVQFSKNPSKNSFYFTENEIPSDAEKILKDENDNIYGYVLNALTYFKNINITNEYGISIANNFDVPKLENNLLVIPVNKRNSIQFDDERILKVINVTLNSEIEDEFGVKMNEDFSWNYQINSTTVAKAKINFSIVDGETKETILDNSAGSLNFLNYEEFDIGKLSKELTLNITNKYQFYGWEALSKSDDYSTDVSNYFEITSPNSLSTSLNIKEECENVVVNAVVYKRPYVDLYSPKSDAGNSEFPKNNPISISFGHAIEDSVENNVQLVYSNGNINKDDYFVTTLNDDKTQINLASIKFLTLANLPETVTVRLPHDKIYYLASDGVTKIFMDEKEDFVGSYEINNYTMTKSTVRFMVNNPESKITGFTVDDVILNSGTKVSYYLGQELNIEYPLSEGYRFMGWKLQSATDLYKVINVNNSIILRGVNDYIDYITLKTSGTKATLTVNDAVGNGMDFYGVTLSASDILIPAVDEESTSPKFESKGVSYNTPILIKFNKKIDKNSVAFTEKSSSNILIQNVSYGALINSYFYEPIISDYSIKLIPQESISTYVTNGLADLRVTVSNVCDINGNEINGSYIWSYRINETKEDVPPTIKTVDIYRDARESDSSGKYDFEIGAESISAVKLLNTSYSYWNNTSSSTGYIKNHIKDTVYIDCSGYDEVTGVESIIVQETLLRTYKYNDYDVKNVLISEEKCGNEEFYEIKALSGDYSLRTPVKYKIKSENDGLIKLRIFLMDKAGNKSDDFVEFYVIKDTQVLVPDSECVTEYRDIYRSDLHDNVIKLQHFWEGYAVPCQEYVRLSDSNEDEVTLTFCDDARYSNYGRRSYTKDIYCNYSTSYIGDHAKNNITVEYSYDQLEWINIDGIKSGITTDYTFTRDKTKSTFVRITASDAVGNVKSKIRVIPKTPSIISHALSDKNKLLSEQVSNYLGHAAFLKAGFNDSIDEIESSGAEDYNCFVFYRYKASDSEEFTEFRCEPNKLYEKTKLNDDLETGFFTKATMVYNSVFDQQTYRPAGKYEVFLIPYYKYTDAIYVGAASDPYEFDISYNVEGEMSIIHSTGTDPEDSDLFPKKCVITLDKPEFNTGIQKAHFSYELQENETFIPNNEYKYFVGYRIKDSDSEYTYVGSNSFDLKSTYEYEIKYFALHRNSSLLSIPCEHKVLNADGSCYYQPYIDATHDNLPPEMISNGCLYDIGNFNAPLNTLCITKDRTYMDLPYDSGVGLKTNDNGEVVFKYWILRAKTQAYFGNDNYREDDLIGIEGIDFSYNPNNGYIYIPYDSSSLERGWYSLVLRLEDKNGNYAYKTFQFAHNPQQLPENISEPSLEFKKLKDNANAKYYGFEVDCNYSRPWPYTRDYPTYYAYADYFDEDSQQWIRVNMDVGYVTNDNGQKTKAEINLLCDSSINSFKYDFITDKSKYFRISFSDYGSINGGAYNTETVMPSKFETQYLYTDFEVIKADNVTFMTDCKLKDAPVCNMKNILLGSNGAQVFCDNKTLLQLCYSSIDLGEDAHEWLCNSAIVETKLLSSSGTFAYDKSIIPSGKYYAVIAHFADGSSCVSDVKYKK